MNSLLPSVRSTSHDFFLLGEFRRQSVPTLRTVWFGVLAVLWCGAWNPVLAQTRAVTATTLALTSSGTSVTSVASGSVVTLTAMVKAGAAAVTTGQVNFCDATLTHCTDIHLLGTAQLTSAGTATMKFRPGIGSHSYKAIFLGTNTNAGSASGASALTATGSIPSLASATTIHQTGGWGAYTLSATITETGNTAAPNGTVSFLDSNHGNAVLGAGTLGTPTRGVAWSTVSTSAPSVAGVSYAVADLNRDGIPDLFVKDYFGTYDVLLGKGDGTFTVAGSPFGPSSETGSFIIGDFNNDGIPDVAAINADYYASSNSITIFLGNGDGTFTVAASSPPLGYGPAAIATADMNGDGNADLVVVQQGSSTSSGGQVLILFGNGDGTFTQASSKTSIASVASSIIPADLNSDGKMDLLLTGVGQTGITVLLGKGDGSFTTVTGPGQLGETMAAVADVNNDGIPDLVFPSSSNSYLTVFLGNGDGTFTEAPSSPNSNMKLGNFAIADFNQDGIPDIVYAVPNTTTAEVLLGNGDGSFQQTPGILTYSYDFSAYLVIGDFNGDGLPDVLTEDGNSRTVIDSLTQPTETAIASVAVSIAAAGTHLADASYSGDANYNPSTSGNIALWGAPPATATSLAITSGGTSVSSVPPGTVVTLTAKVLVGSSPVTAGQVNFCDAAATFCTDIHLLATVALTNSGTAAFKFAPGSGVHNYKAMFVENGYGLSSSSAASALTVSPAKSSVYSDTTSISDGGSPGNYSLTATVLGLGGSAPPTGNISFLDTSFANAPLGTAALGSSTPGIGWLIAQTPAFNNNPDTQVTGDFNGDGIPDLAILWSNNTYSGPYSATIYFGKGDGSFTTGPTVQVAGVQSYPSMTTGDFNGDGKTDMAILSWATNSNTSVVTTLLGNGDGTFSAPQTSTVFSQGAVGGDFISGTLVAADFNGDGKVDLAVVGDYVSFGGVTILLGKGDGTFNAAGPNLAPNLGFNLVASGDFNGDGIPDLVATNYFSPSGATIFLGKGDGTFTTLTTSIAVGTFPYSIVVGDFNGDQKLDLAIGFSSSVSIFLGNGDGTFNQTSGSPISGAGQSLVAGDFNHDGKLDLAGIDKYNDQIDLFMGGGDGTFTETVSTPNVSQANNGPFSIVAADFNGDGVPDLAMLTPNVATASILLTEPSETATATVTGIAPLGAGTHNVDASYPGDSNYVSSTSGTVSLTAALAPLVLMPAAGSYSSAQTITISESVPGATIYYSANGVVNTNGFVPYTAPIQLTEGGVETVIAYATETGYQNANYLTSTFIMNLPVAPTPVFSQGSGSYTSPQSVTISDSVAGATIYYTTNGVLPTTSSAVYSGPISVSTSETLVAIAIANGYSMSPTASAQYLIATSSTSLLYTVAGNGSFGYSGDGGPATVADLNYPMGAIPDGAGNLYFADASNNVIRKVAAGTGIISTIVGAGTIGYSGDNGAATSAQLNDPMGVVLDKSGNLYIADLMNFVVRRVSAATGVITTYAGTGTEGYSGDNGPASGAMLGYIGGIAVDGTGNLFISDQIYGVVRKVNATSGVITTVAGNGQYGYSGDNGAATSASLGYPSGIAVDISGNLFIADYYNNVIRKVNATNGVITTVVGNGFGAGKYSGGYTGDGGSALSAELNLPRSVAVDTLGNLYIDDFNNNVIRKVTASNGIITTVVGNGNTNDCNPQSGDGSAATSVTLCFPTSVSVDSAGNLYVANSSIGKILVASAASLPPTTSTAAPTLSLSAGTYASPQTVTIVDSTPGASIYVTTDGTTPATNGVGYNGPINVSGTVTIKAVAIAPGYLQSAPVTSAYTITSPPTAIISTAAGSGVYGNSGVGGPAPSAQIGYPMGVAFDGSGNLYFSDTGNNVVWMLTAKTGNLSVVAGNGMGGYSGDGGSATSAGLNSPQGVVLDSAGNLYIADSNNNVVREVNASTGLISTVAGVHNGSGNLGNGGLATKAGLSYPNGLALDSAGNLYIADQQHNSVRKITASTGIITSVAGNGTYTDSGDGGLATSAGLGQTMGLTFDSAGNLYIAETYNGRVRKVAAATGIITTVAGNGNQEGSSGDGLPATQAEIEPAGIAIDSAGNLFLSELQGSIREVAANTGIITRVAGNGHYGYSGDGGSATLAEMKSPQEIAFDVAGSLYIADSGNSRIRKVTFPSPVAAPSFSLAAGSYYGTQSIAIADSIAGAAIYYTTDGSTPTTASNLYSGPISLPATGTLQAIAVATGYTQSAVTTAAYSILAKVVPAITWATPTAIPYGMALSATQLDATSTVAGTFAYLPATGAVLDAGAQTLSAKFTPTNTTQYTTATITVQLMVNPNTPTIAWPTPAAITYGTAVSSAQLNATSTIPGSFVYSPVAGTVLGAGTQTLSTTYTPNNATDYTAATAKVQLTVNKATPSITWPTPAAITSGTTLGSTQLNATTSVPGTFVYSPAAGTTPALGSDALSVTFSPSDSTDYNIATATVTLLVNSPSNPIPVVNSLSPSFTSAGSTAFTITITGTGFLSSSTAYWGTTALSTQFVSASQLTAQVTSGQVAGAGITAISVQSPAPGGGASNALQFEVDTAGTGSGTAPTFTSLTASVAPGAVATYPVTLPSTATNISVTCLNLPSGATCAYSSTSNAVTITTLATTAAGTYQVTVIFTETLPGAATAFVILPILLLPLFLLRRRLLEKGIWTTACMGLVMLALTVAAVGCGGGGSGSSPVSPTNPTHQVMSSGGLTLTIQ